MADTYKVKHRQHRLLDSGHNGVVFPVVMLQLSDTNPTKFDQGMFVILKEIFLEMIEELDAIPMMQICPARFADAVPRPGTKNVIIKR